MLNRRMARTDLGRWPKNNLGLRSKLFDRQGRTCGSGGRGATPQGLRPRRRFGGMNSPPPPPPPPSESPGVAGPVAGVNLAQGSAAPTRTVGAPAGIDLRIRLEGGEGGPRPRRGRRLPSPQPLCPAAADGKENPVGPRAEAGQNRGNVPQASAGRAISPGALVDHRVCRRSGACARNSCIGGGPIPPPPPQADR